MTTTGLAAALLSLVGCNRADEIVQPVQFNHRVHTEEGLSCDGCHEWVERAAFAGLPPIDTCVDCHDLDMTENPEEDKILEYAAAGAGIPWRLVTAVPGHTYFSHRRHVTLAKLDCSICHGAIGQSESPPAQAAVAVTMDWCVDCHATNDVGNDCISCHR